ncbi:holliday junction DNA helicase, RuvA subunit [Rubidibacter lacunae KORDI 51-2]|uniref:Holliday junction branch migration complex subunit RuvA n=1 Tax=Rubidibacter lacunae KORDI 51-2 TaxID=582515 RepID=U5DEZ0_9CHRO|nr:Holliday junction branch migration protein RuvA [Rubidibacter lacunae]ERN39867.1 holliday junction DNA helicase, RuvA subunit [Rubidibacter lacunae KORDI 51-2]
MIAYLRGTVHRIVKRGNTRTLLILEVGGIGYELQIPRRLARELVPDPEAVVQIYAHQQIRDDQLVLYGFATAAERDLFRQLVSVSGIGSQLAIAALDTLGLNRLVEAIVAGDTHALAKVPGVGTKTAERMALELKTKLAQWRQASGMAASQSALGPALDLREDVEMTLLALGYAQDEIEHALSALALDSVLLANPQPEEWIRRAIAWLSQ